MGGGLSRPGLRHLLPYRREGAPVQRQAPSFPDGPSARRLLHHHAGICLCVSPRGSFLLHAPAAVASAPQWADRSHVWCCLDEVENALLSSPATWSQHSEVLTVRNGDSSAVMVLWPANRVLASMSLLAFIRVHVTSDWVIACLL